MSVAIMVTESASTQVRKIIRESGSGATGIRVGVQGGGCAGLSYTLDLEEQEQEDDRVYPIDEDLSLYVDKKSFLFLAGTTLDWTGGLNGKGFEFSNPNVVSSCWCGSSFST